MKIEDFLSAHDVLLDLRAPNKSRLLRDLTGRAARALRLDPASLADPIAQREQLGSTGMGDGIAIPHARIAGLAKPFGQLTRLGRAIDFAAIDGRPVDLVFLLLLPGPPHGERLNALASVARRLRDGDVTARLRAVRTGEEMYRAICGEE